jgi:hypothetical protein
MRAGLDREPLERVAELALCPFFEPGHGHGRVARFNAKRSVHADEDRVFDGRTSEVIGIGEGVEIDVRPERHPRREVRFPDLPALGGRGEAEAHMVGDETVHRRVEPIGMGRDEDGNAFEVLEGARHRCPPGVRRSEHRLALVDHDDGVAKRGLGEEGTENRVGGLAPHKVPGRERDERAIDVAG